VPVGQLRRTLEAVRRFRGNFVFGALLVLFVAALVRVADLQLARGAELRGRAEKLKSGSIRFQGLRGQIFDARGRLLAASSFGREVAVDARPGVVLDVADFSERLAATLDDALTASRIAETIATKRAGPARGRGHVVLFSCLQDRRLLQRLDDLARVDLRAVGLYGLIVTDVERRSYPNGTYAAHVLGQTPRRSSAPGGREHGAGIERSPHDSLTGASVRAEVRWVGLKRPLAVGTPVDRGVVRGEDARLALDVVVQHFAETALDQVVSEWQAEEAVAIVLDPRTGEVLALANRPTFDPNGYATTMNLAVAGLYEPGSSFKPFTAARALALGAVAPDEVLPMPASRWFPGEKRPISDSHEVGDGTVVRLVGHSSNTGAAELAERMGAEGMKRLVAALGFGAPTGIELPGEAAPSVADKHWPVWQLHRAAFGQSILVTPIHLAASFAAFARDDARPVRPTLFPGRGGPRTDLPPVCRPEDLAVVREGLAACVDEGTARAAFEGCAHAVSGKTGTAQVMGQERYVCSFVGYAPRAEPRLLVLVLALVAKAEGRSGGAVAAPAARRLLERALAYLDVPVRRRVDPYATALEADPGEVEGG
jgi:cell division protein FtsI/penicillin-binding protein 2